MAFVNRIDGQIVAPQLINETLDCILHIAARTVGVRWHADDDRCGLPFFKQPGDCVVIDAIVPVRDNSQRARRCRDVLPDSNTDAAQTEIESQDCFRAC